RTEWLACPISLVYIRNESFCYFKPSGILPVANVTIWTDPTRVFLFSFTICTTTKCVPLGCRVVSAAYQWVFSVFHSSPPSHSLPGSILFHSTLLGWPYEANSV